MMRNLIDGRQDGREHIRLPFQKHAVTIKVLTSVHLCLDMQRLFGPDSALCPAQASDMADAGTFCEATS